MRRGYRRECKVKTNAQGKRNEKQVGIYHAPITNTDRLSIIFSSERSSTLCALVTEYVSTVSTMML
jgi:hypothetical protein